MEAQIKKMKKSLWVLTLIHTFNIEILNLQNSLLHCELGCKQFAGLKDEDYTSVPLMKSLGIFISPFRFRSTTRGDKIPKGHATACEACGDLISLKIYIAVNCIYSCVKSRKLHLRNFRIQQE
jgi:hypothetical protein